MFFFERFILGADSLGLEIQNTVDISDTSNFELVMRLSTNINSSSEFYTDLNGFQVIIIIIYCCVNISMKLMLFSFPGIVNSQKTFSKITNSGKLLPDA